MKKKYKITDEDFAKMKKVNSKRNKYVDNSFYLYLSFNVRMTLLILLIIGLGVFAIYSFDNSFSVERTDILEYSESADADTNIIFNESVINGNITNENGFYYSSIIDNIITNFDYKYEVSENVDLKYDYEVNAIVTIKDNNGEVISDGINENIISLKTGEVKGKEFSVSPSVVVDFDRYNNYVKDYMMNQNNLVVANLDIVLCVNTKYYHNEYNMDINNSKMYTVNIPLGIDVIKINEEKYSNSDAYVNHVETEVKNAKLLYSGVIAVIFDTLLILGTINYFYKAMPKKSKYCILRDGILKDYDKIIVNTRKMPNKRRANIIDCYSFQELYDAQKLLEKPILYYELVRNQKALFYIIDGEDVYQYVLKECDLDY